LSGYSTIDYALRDRVALVTLNRPERLNALNAQVFAEMTAAIDEGLADGARALVLTGAGRAFCSGADLQDRSIDTSDLGAMIDAAYNPFARKLAAVDVPVITAVNGLAAGAGCGLALMGDISVMARSAYLVLAFVNIGLVPDAGATWLVAKGAGRTKALEMALLGEKLTAEDALAAGLVTRVVDEEAVLDEALAIARKLASGPSVAIGMIRKQVAAALTASFDETLEIERANQRTTGQTADFREAVTAFAQKRAPNFTGS